MASEALANEPLVGGVWRKVTWWFATLGVRWTYFAHTRPRGRPHHTSFPEKPNKTGLMNCLRCMACGVAQIAPLGHGAYSAVFSATHIHTGERVAVKDVIFHNQREGVPSTSIREVLPPPLCSPVKRPFCNCDDMSKSHHRPAELLASLRVRTPQRSPRQVSILKSMVHPNIVTLKDVCHEIPDDPHGTERLTLVLEFVQ